MHTRDLQRYLEKHYGRPKLLRWEGEITERERRMVRGDDSEQRAHDVTFFIHRDDEYVLIRKPFFPPGAWRIPSGGVKSGEEFLPGIEREAFEETGLRIALEKYLVRTEAHFRYGSEIIPWTTHVVLARAPEGHLAPRDRTEIADARWGTLEELQGPIRQALLATGQALFRYRVALTDAAVEVIARDR